jgi:dynein heavy chain
MHNLSDYKADIKELAMKITYGTIQLYKKINEKLLRTPIKFHYVFNLRDLSKIFEGMSFVNKNF